MLISPAYAQAAGAPTGGGDFLIQLLPLILIFVIFYFFLIRPQQRKAKEHKKMLDAIRRNDTVVTQGGLHGKVVKVGDDTLELEIAPNVRVKAVRATIATVLSKSEPAGDA